MMRFYNQKLVLRILKDKSPLSKTELSNITHLTVPAITDILSDLETFNLIEADDYATPVKRGRYPVLHHLKSDAYQVIGVAIESKSIKTALTNLNGDLLDSLTLPLPTKPSPESVVNKVEHAVNELIAKSQTYKQKLMGIGLGMHGIVNADKGIAVYAPHLDWRNVPIGDLLGEKFAWPIKVDNDCNALALSERWFGQGKETKSFIVVNFDYGVGASFMVDGQLFYGNNYGGGQIGHTVVQDDGPLCSCGNYGCLESIASEPSLLREVLKKVKQGFPSKILTLAGSVEAISIEHLYEAANLSDDQAKHLLETAGRYSGIAISTLVNLFNPQKVILTGGVLRGKEHVITPLVETVKRHSLETNVQDLEITTSKIKMNSTALGAASLWINDLFNGELPLENLGNKKIPVS